MPSIVEAATKPEDQIAHMKNALREYVARRCPASRLPIELWDLIFEECVPDAPNLSLVDAPLNVSQVCRRWRNISLSNPVLWSALAVTPTRHHIEHDYALEALHRIVQLWLRRSVARPLSVSLAQSDAVESEGPISLLLDAVLLHAPHLRSLDIRTPEACLVLLDSPALYLPALERLKIETPWPQLAASITLPLHRAPRLCSLAVLSFAATPVTSFDYTQLTELTLLPDAQAPPEVFWTAEETLTFLAEAPRLRTLRIAVNDFMPRRRILAHADALLSLTLEFRDALSTVPRRRTRLGAFFSLLYTPNLRQLTLRDRGAAHPAVWPLYQFLDTWPQAQFLAYLGATQLRALTLEHLPLYETEVIECLQRVPLLTELVLEARAQGGSQRNVGDLLLCALTSRTVPPNGTPIVTALRKVEFRHCGKRCTEQALISMVDSRLGALEYLRVHRSALPSQDLAARMARWDMVKVDMHY
ncbi:hypothetical protein C8F04DRAFT_1066796 [Mycena alexandri]|uniref:F-box domain-containing protein n=1 Tax=Mycena alexandri TaxID=1745969 RepID=A0AAD6XDG3_9AGAR|nr:hypothetical protein C8F04DRAFT_1066796 [Mycena alexandri]